MSFVIVLINGNILFSATELLHHNEFWNRINLNDLELKDFLESVFEGRCEPAFKLSDIRGDQANWSDVRVMGISLFLSLPV